MRYFPAEPTFDVEIAALAGLTAAANKFPYFTSSTAAALADITAAGRALVDDAAATDQRTTLGVGTADSPQFAGLNVGHATDTTLTRIAAGELGIEGVSMRPITRVIGLLIGADMNSTADQAIPILGATKYWIRRILITNASLSLTTAAGGFYSAASKGGTAIVANTQVYTALSAATKVLSATLAAAGTADTFAVQTLYISLTTPQAVAATADCYVIADVLA